MNDIEAFENNITARATASRQVNLNDTVYTPNIKLHQVVGANDTVYEPSICFNLKNSNNQTVLTEQDRAILTAAGVTDTNNMDRVCLTKKHFVSLYSLKSIIEEFKRNITELYNKALNIKNWKQGAETSSAKTLEAYLKNKYYTKPETMSKEESNRIFLPKAQPDNPYLTKETADTIYEAKVAGRPPPDQYYLTRDAAGKKYAPINNNYISVSDLDKYYEPTGDYISQQLLNSHMEQATQRIISNIPIPTMRKAA